MSRTSPRITKLLHEPGEFTRLGEVIGIRQQGRVLDRNPGATPLARRRLNNGLARRFSTRHPTPARQLASARAPSHRASVKAERAQESQLAFSAKRATQRVKISTWLRQAWANARTIKHRIARSPFVVAPRCLCDSREVPVGGARLNEPCQGRSHSCERIDSVKGVESEAQRFKSPLGPTPDCPGVFLNTAATRADAPAGRSYLSELDYAAREEHGDAS